MQEEMGRLGRCYYYILLPRLHRSGSNRSRNCSSAIAVVVAGLNSSTVVVVIGGRNWNATVTIVARRLYEQEGLGLLGFH